MRPAVSVTGFKKSGKTTLMLALAQELKKRGLKVGAIKFSHHTFSMENTDTDRLAQECAAVVGICPDQTRVYWNAARKLHDMLPLLDADVVLVEGGKSLNFLPRIVLPETDEDASLLDNGLVLASWGRGALPGVRPAGSLSELADLVLKAGFVLPGLDCGACGRENCHGLAREIVAGQALSSDCQALSPQVKICMGGQALTLNPFAQRLVASTIRGLLTELKGNVAGQDIEISLRRNS